ncbi:hypothetical protein FIBSPDRAFT_958773 [Athelia psychrophila]|uniref:Uncharacterized protein n=1 Tax=Athelia psychrophila TaxID=1759441 RepID=A0A166E686_9AGAM|nr:hypothetical protein FIBSPDRAFT_958773 [Fibularhizoctonia sp. CBS 109695]
MSLICGGEDTRCSSVRSSKSTAQSSSASMFIGGRFLIGMDLTFADNVAPILVTPKSGPPTTHTRSRSTIPGPGGLPRFCRNCPPRHPDDILACYHADDDDVRYEFNDIKATIELDRPVNANVDWKLFFATPGNKKRMRVIVACWLVRLLPSRPTLLPPSRPTLLPPSRPTLLPPSRPILPLPIPILFSPSSLFLPLCPQWSGNGLVSYYLDKVLDQISTMSPAIQLLINGIPPSGTASGRSSPRRSSTSSGAASPMIAFIFLFYAAHDLAFAPLIASYTIVYVVWLAFEGVFIYFNILETKNLALEETVERLE